MPQRILFYQPEDAFGWLTALSPHPVSYNGMTWPTAEHAYQAQKLIDETTRQKLLGIADAREAKSYARQVAIDARRPDWDAVKVEIMHDIQKHKFLQHPQLANLLLETGEAELVENAPDDSFWGWNIQSGGLNTFGKILMQVRRQLK